MQLELFLLIPFNAYILIPLKLLLQVVVLICLFNTAHSSSEKHTPTKKISMVFQPI